MATWNETAPANTDLISAGAGEIRQLKTDIRERMDNEHVWTATGANTEGTHQPGFITEASTYLATDSIVAANIKNDAVTALKLPATLRTSGACFIIDGAGLAITPGIKGDIVIPFTGTLTEVWLLGDTVGSIQVDMWKNSYAGYPPTAGYTISARNISGNIKSQYTGLATAITTGDIIRFNVDSCTTITRCTIFLKIVRTV